jgi:hypothetical protein
VAEPRNWASSALTDEEHVRAWIALEMRRFWLRLEPRRQTAAAEVERAQHQQRVRPGSNRGR